MNFRLFATSLKWQIKINLGNLATWLIVLGFYILIILLFPLTIAPLENILQPVAVGVIFSSILLASLLSLDKLFFTDVKKACLYDWLDYGIYHYLLAKILAHWLFVYLPLIISTPILARILYFPTNGIWLLLIFLTLTSFVIQGLGALVAALTSGLNNANLLVGFILIPLCLPIILLSSLGLEAYLAGFNFLPHLAFLTGVLLLIFALAPLGIVLGLKNSLAS